MEIICTVCGVCILDITLNSHGMCYVSDVKWRNETIKIVCSECYEKLKEESEWK